VGCQEKGFDKPLELGGTTIAPEVLNRGKTVYRSNCAGCHGPRGDGDVGSSRSMKPAPRDFRAGNFKFSSVPKGGLPTDDDLLRTIRRGLRGTHMPGWSRLSDSDAIAVAQYLKTFSPRWQQPHKDAPISIPPDPWRERNQAAVERGGKVYHGKADCWSCHPGYLPSTEIVALGRALRGERKEEPATLRTALESSREVIAEYGPDKPPDFLRDQLRCDLSDDDVYRTIAAGVGGTPMKGWLDLLPPEDIWALVHYVRDLQRLRGTPEAERIRTRSASAAGEHGQPSQEGR